jgi:hypothetical protein
MDSWDRFTQTGDIRDYLAYKKEETEDQKTGEKHEQPELYSDRYRFVCKTGGGI